MSPDVPAPDPDVDPPGCGMALSVLAAYFGFAAATVTVGITSTNLWAYFSGLPVSAVFSAIGNDLILAWPLDSVLWMSAAWMTASRNSVRRLPVVVLTVLASATAFGYLLSRFIEPTGSFL